MTKKLSGRTAFILVIGLLMGASYPSFAGAADAQPDTAVTAQLNSAGNSSGNPAADAQAAPAAQTPEPGTVGAATNDDVRQPVVVTQQAEPAAPRAHPVVAGSQNATWDETSLIGKIFIGFGALLTIASAARMFMA
jgi:hypothetical protein